MSGSNSGMAALSSAVRSEAGAAVFRLLKFRRERGQRVLMHLSRERTAPGFAGRRMASNIRSTGDHEIAETENGGRSARAPHLHQREIGGDLE